MAYQSVVVLTVLFLANTNANWLLEHFNFHRFEAPPTIKSTVETDTMNLETPNSMANTTVMTTPLKMTSTVAMNILPPEYVNTLPSMIQKMTTLFKKDIQNNTYPSKATTKSKATEKITNSLYYKVSAKSIRPTVRTKRIPIHQRGVLDLLFPAEGVKSFKDMFNTMKHFLLHTL